MSNDSNGPFIHNKLTLKITLPLLICFTLIATSAISIPTSNINKSINNSEEVGCSGIPGCSVNITKPARATAYFFDGFEFPLLIITVPIIFGGITCKAEVNITNGEEPNYLQWKFANFLGDIYWSYPIPYKSGVSKYEYYMGKVNFGQFKIWIYCYDINSQVICENTISCLKLF